MSCLSVTLWPRNFNLGHIFLIIRDILHIWHAYSTNETNDTKGDDFGFDLYSKNSHFRPCYYPMLYFIQCYVFFTVPDNFATSR